MIKALRKAWDFAVGNERLRQRGLEPIPMSQMPMGLGMWLLLGGPLTAPSVAFAAVAVVAGAQVVTKTEARRHDRAASGFHHG